MAGFEDFETPQMSSGAIRPAPGYNELSKAWRHAESNNGDPNFMYNASSGATGPLQITKIAADAVGGDYERAKLDNVYAEGISNQYGRMLWKQFGGDPVLTTAAYHTGPTKIRSLLSKVPEGEDPAAWVTSQLGPQGQKHIEKVMGRFSGQLKYDPETGRFTEPNAAKIKPTFGMFEEPTVGDLPLASDSPTRRNRSDYNTINTDGSVNWSETWEKTKRDAKDAGLNTLGVLNIIAGIPAFVLGSSVAAGSAGVGALGRLAGFGKSDVTGKQEPVSDITDKAIKQGEEVSELFNKYFNPVTLALNAAKSSEALDDTMANKAMGELTKAVKGYSKAMEKQYGVDAGAVEISVNQYMSMALARKGAGAGVGAEARASYDPVKNQYGNARRPGMREAEVVDAEVVPDRLQLTGPVARKPSFRDFEDASFVDAFAKDTFEAAAKEEATATKGRMLKGAALVSAPAAIAGGMYLYNKFKPQGNQLIDEGEPQPTEEGTMLSKASKTVTGDEYDKLLNQFGSLAAIPFAIGAVKGKGGMWHPEAVKRLSQPLKDKIAREGGPQDTYGIVQSMHADANAWVDRAVKNYLNKHAGTATDPLKDVEIPVGNSMQKWETVMDRIIKGKETEGPRGPETQWDIAYRGRSAEALVDIPPGARDLETYGGQAVKSYLSHVGDYLRQNVAPEKLQQYDLVRAVKETAANDARVAKEMEKAAAASTKDLPVYKEYPDGMKWVEFKQSAKLTPEQMKGIKEVPGNWVEGNMDPHTNMGREYPDKAYAAIDTKGKEIINSYTEKVAVGRTPEEAHLAGQLAQEGNQMGHCVGGYCQPVASGESRIFSLRDKKGQSHVTIEVQPADPNKINYNSLAPEDDASIGQHHMRNTTDIVQIKGKQNRAPVTEYLPYVQDFVKGGKWGEVGDLGNTGLYRLEDAPVKRGPTGEFMERLPPSDLAAHPERAKLSDATDRLLKRGERFANREDIFKEAGVPLEEFKSGLNKQRGSVDIRLVKALALAGVGATAGAALFPDDRLTAALVGGVLALGLGHTKISALPQILSPNSKLARSVGRGIEASVQQFIRNVNPDLMGKQAESAASVLGKNYTEMMQRQLSIEIPSQKRMEFWYRQGISKGRAFLKAMERGAAFTDPTMNAYATVYRTWMDKIYKQDQLGGVKYEPIDNYVYHAFEDPVGASTYFEKKYGLKWGDPSFTKDRMFQLIEDAEKHGFKLKAENPESLMVMRQHASDIASMKIQALRDLAEYGLARKIEKGKPALAGEVTWRSPNGELYALPDQTNQVMHNAFNTKSLWADLGVAGQIFRALSYAKNAIVPISLFGLFHPLHVQLGMSFADPLTTMTKRWAAGMVPFSDIIKEGITKFALADVATNLIKGGSLVPESGWRTMQAWKGEIPFNKLTAVDKHNLNLMLEGTFNPIMPIEYRNQHIKDFRKAVLENGILRSGGNLLPMIMEKFYTKPIFEKWIPEVKLAAYLRGANDALEANPGLLNAPLERINALRKISKMVDDRFGEVAYKTLFMNRWVKDVAIASFLSYGWQLGFVRSYVGAIPEAVSAATGKGGFREKIAKGDLDKSLFVGYYITGTMLYAGLLTYALTGEAPKDIMDYIYPRTGQKNPDGSEARVSTPFYTREFVSIPKHMQESGIVSGLGITVANKLSPAIGMLKAIVTNKDFFNREISDPDAGMMERLGQRLSYAFKSMQPISISGAEKGPPGAKTQVLSVLGFTPAPKYVTDTPIEQKIKHEYGKYHQSTIPYKQGKKMEERTELYRLKQLGQEDKFEEGLEKLKDKYNMTPGEVTRLRKNAGIPTADRLFGQLPNKTQEKLLNQMSKEEQERFRPRAGKLLRYQ